jgi:MoaA/NifB/PqqE/SkfB family radical SAM enzyme
MKIFDVTVIPTRVCNLDCSYCKIKRKTADNELRWDQWVDVLSKLESQIPTLCFMVLLGGEITTWKKDFLSFTKRMRERVKTPWGFTTNGILLNRKFLQELKAAGQNYISISLDSLVHTSLLDKYEMIKSEKTLELIDLINELGFEETHCTITVDKNNLEELPFIVEFLSKKGVYSEITPLIFGKDDSYDYASSLSEMKDRVLDSPTEVDDVMHEIVSMKEEGYLIHNTDDYLLNWREHGIYQKWKCYYPYNLVLDSDGSCRLCLHIKGKRVPKHHTSSFNYEEFLSDWKKDFKELCKGCYWNCQYEPKYIWDETKDLECVRNYFSHEVKHAEEKIKSRMR